MTTTKSLLAVIAAVVGASALASQSAQAVQINGTIDLAGVARFNGPLATATQVTSFRNAHVEFSTNDFATFTNTNDAVAFTAPYVFNPSTAYSPLYSVGGFVFDLAESHIMTQNANALVILGTGTLMGNGFDATPGTWAFSSQNPSGNNKRTRFSFSAGTDAIPTPTPDGGSAIALLGLSLVAVEAVRRKLGKA